MSETAEFAGGFAMFVIVKQRLCCGFTAAAAEEEEEELADVDPRAARKAATPPIDISWEEEENMSFNSETRAFFFYISLAKKPIEISALSNKSDGREKRVRARDR
jgi:hypothetical protein